MGMANSDDEAAIMKEYDMMETIRRRTPGYHHATHNMNEDMKAIYDSSLKSEYLNPTISNHCSPPPYNSEAEAEAKPLPRRNPNDSSTDEDELDKKIKELRKKIEIAKLEKELADLLKYRK